MEGGHAVERRKVATHTPVIHKELHKAFQVYVLRNRLRLAVALKLELIRHVLA